MNNNHPEQEEHHHPSSTINNKLIIIGGDTQTSGAALPPARHVIVEWFTPLVNEIKQKQRLFLLSTMNDKDNRDTQHHASPASSSSKHLDASSSSVLLNGLMDNHDSITSVDLSSVGPYISMLTAEELAVTVIHSTLSSTLKAGGGILASTAATTVGRAVHAQVNIKKLRKAKRAHVLSSLPRDSQFIQTGVNHMTHVMLPDEESNWSPETTVQVGGFLLHQLLNVASVPVKRTESLSSDLMADLLQSDHDKNSDGASSSSSSPSTSSDLQSALEFILSDYSNDPFSSTSTATTTTSDDSTIKQSSSDESSGSTSATTTTTNDPKVKMEPAFRHDLEYSNGRVYGVIAIHESLTNIVNEAHSLLEGVEPALLPMNH